MHWWEKLDLQTFLSHHPKLCLKRMDDEEVWIEGAYNIRAQMDGGHSIDECYSLKIIIYRGYPRRVPMVLETTGRIPRNPDHHVYDNGSFCLGSEIKLKSIIFDNARFEHFAAKILDLFLYNVSCKIRFNVFPNGELRHGVAGLIDDYQILFGVTGRQAVADVLKALGKRRRVANKLPCPCRCGNRLGKCKFRYTLTPWRQLDTRRWYRDYLAEHFKPIEKPRATRPKSKRPPSTAVM